MDAAEWLAEFRRMGILQADTPIAFLRRLTDADGAGSSSSMEGGGSRLQICFLTQTAMLIAQGRMQQAAQDAAELPAAPAAGASRPGSSTSAAGSGVPGPSAWR
jgi:hypothetical protein